MSMTYDSRNRVNLDKLAPNTKKAAYQFYQYCIDNKVDILIYETARTVEQQRKYLAEGKSQTMKSYHLVGQALDFVPVVKGETIWDGYSSAKVKKAIAYAKSIGFEWGGDWKNFVDSPHLQFNYKGYGTDKRLDEKAQVKTGKKYRIHTGHWKKSEIEHCQFIENKIRKEYGYIVYRMDEGGRYYLKTGTFNNYDACVKAAKDIQNKYGILCFVVEA